MSMYKDMNPAITEILLSVPRDWQTPATMYPEGSVGDAEIVRDFYPRGYYRMERVGGYVLWYNHYRIPVTELKIRGQTVMVDDPLHWIGMQRLAEASVGNTLVAGLGLGLVVHALARNSRVTRIDVVEIEPDVVKLIAPHLPRDPRVRVHEGNAFTWRGEYDTVIVDLLVRDEPTAPTVIAGGQTPISADELYHRFSAQHPNARVYLWGVRDPTINPAVEP